MFTRAHSPRRPAPALLAAFGLAFLVACGGEPTAVPTAEATAEPAATIAPAGATLLLIAKDLRLEGGACTTLEWETTNARQVYLDGRGVDPAGAEEVCPTASTTYKLSAIDASGAEKSTEVTVEVAAPTAAPTPTSPPLPTRAPVTAAPTGTPAPTVAPTSAVQIQFWADSTELDEDTSCTAVRWRTSGIKEVHIEREGLGKKAVAGESSEEVCIGRGEKVKYFLHVTHLDGRQEVREITIKREN